MYKVINNTKIYYNILGEGEPIVFLHGWGSNSKVFYKIAKHLSRSYKNILFDLPGFGNSDEPNEPLDVSGYLEIVNNLLKEIDIDNPIIIAHSLGGRIASKFNNKLDKLVLIGSAGIKTKKSVKLKIKIYTYKLMKWILSLLHMNKTKERLIRKSGSTDYRNASNIMKKTLINVVNEDLREFYKTIKVPTLIIWGENDKETPLWMGKDINSLVENSELVVFNNAGHYVFIDKSDDVIKEVERFLNI